MHINILLNHVGYSLSSKYPWTYLRLLIDSNSSDLNDNTTTLSNKTWMIYIEKSLQEAD